MGGKVNIRVDALDEDLELDAEELTISAVSVDGRAHPFTLDAKSNKLRLPGLPRGRSFILDVAYEKTIPDKANTGIHKARYGDSYFIATDFEPDRARTFMPCKDEPSWKAVFTLRVTTEQGLRVISNSPVRSEEDTEDGRKRFVFEPTPRMSTYLLFLGVGRFTESFHRQDPGEPAVIAATRRAPEEDTTFILDVSAEVLKECASYFGTAYPLKKLHLVALPEMPGAMENWGAITSYEGGVLLGKNSSGIDRRHGAMVMAHEIAHQWFGDLVTMKWWDDIWLNESFASFMAYKILGNLHPEWDMWSDFIIHDTFGSMRVDELQSTHPIEAKITRPDEINEIFDSISYGKGASILRMVEAYVGFDNFQKGVSDYVRRFSYSNASGSDLWAALSRASSQPVKDIMRTWCTRKGFPLVSVTEQPGKLIFTQKRFLLTGKPEPEDEKPWPIPITMKVNNKVHKMLFDAGYAEYPIDGGQLTQLKVNLLQTGYYCVKYDSHIYSLLESHFLLISGLDRSGLMNDLFHLLEAGEIDPVVYFRFARLCDRAHDYITLSTVLEQLRHLMRVAENSKDVQDVARSFLGRQMKELTPVRREGELPSDELLRGRIAYSLVFIDQDFARELAGRFSTYDTVPPGMKPAVAAAYVRTGGTAAFEELFELLKHSDSETDRDKMYMGLAASDDASLISAMIEFSASGKVSRSDIDRSLVFAAWNPGARQTAWNWVRDNYDRLWDLAGQPAFALGLLQAALPYAAVDREAEALSFFSPERIKIGESNLKQTLDLLWVNARLRARLSAQPVNRRVAL
jgi:tricorn protease interacting factor F2/3